MLNVLPPGGASRQNDSPPDRGGLRVPLSGLRRTLAALVLGPAAALLLSACQHLGDTAPNSGDRTGARAATNEHALAESPAIELIEMPAIERKELVEEDLLARLRGRLTLESRDDAAVQTELRWFAASEAYLHRVFERGSPYLHYIVQELERRDMPADFALLPIVESAFDPFAYSHGRAAGLWQIIPGTGRRLGLRQSWWYDGRRDVIESTRAALDYLEYLHGLFDGDWLLAAAGYNAGEGNVRRAIRRAEAGGDAAPDFWSLRRHLPRETRTYVPRLLALKEVVTDPAAHGVTLPALPNAPYFAVVETGGQIDMALAAELAGVEGERLYLLNPAVNRWATDPDGPHHLLVPYGQAEAFTAALAELAPDERVRWTRHRIEQGDTLIALAQRYRTTPEVLREANNLRGNIIRAGDYLMVPHAVQSTRAYTHTADARAERRQAVERDGHRRVHVVQRGESLWTISRRYGVNVRELASWNAMAPGDVLGVGRQLVVWTRQPEAQPVTAVAASFTAAPAVTGAPGASQSPALIRRVTYVVRRGDSLYSIAQRFRVTVASLVEWNGGVSNQRYLQPGQRLVLYVNVIEQSG